MRFAWLAALTGIAMSGYGTGAGAGPALAGASHAPGPVHVDQYDRSGSERTRGQAPEPSFTAGQVTENVVSVSDPERSYAVYLPYSYRREAVWPVLVLMDPRGRALVPLECFRETAERLGYILISSYDTRSDVAGDPNTPALRAMLDDSQRLFSVNSVRLYLSGFSGTARTAWRYAYQLRSYVAGVIGFGGGLPGRFRLPDDQPFAFFGAAGTHDFNHDEMLILDSLLDDRGTAHRFRAFEGVHQWGPPEVCSEALEWMELRAMRSGLRAPVEAFIDELLAVRLDDARRFEAEGEAFEAWLRYRDAVEDFAELCDVEGIAARADELAATEAVAKAIELQERASRRFLAYVRTVGSVEQKIRGDELPPDVDALARELEVSALQGAAHLDSEAAPPLDRQRAQAAQRLLESAYVQLSFYLPRDLKAGGEPERALAALLLADRIKPDTPRVLLELARTHAGRDDLDKALEVLEHAADVGAAIDPQTLARDPELETLREEPAFERILARLGSRRREATAKPRSDVRFLPHASPA